MTKAQLPNRSKDNKIKQALGLGIGIWEYMEKHQRQFGDTFTLTLPGQGPMVWTSNQQVIKDTLRLKPSQFDASLVQLPIDVGENNTVFLNDREHQDSRKLIVPSFNAKRLRDRAGVMHKIITRHIDGFKPGQEFNIPRLVGDITLDVICYTLLGLTEGERKERYKQAMLNWLLESTSDMMFTIGSMVGTKRYRNFLHKQYLKRSAAGKLGNGKKGLLPWKRSVDLKVQLAHMLKEDIHSIRQRNDESEIHVLSILARTKDADGNYLHIERVVAEAVGLMMAGHETSAATSAWFFIWMQRNPRVVAKIREEAQRCITEEAGYNAAKISELPYITACLNESQRLTPSAVGFIRWLREDTQLGPYKLPAGSAILPNVYLTHRDKAIYGEDALEYRPERWQGEQRFGPSEFLPFGGGARACVGMNQGKQQLRLIFTEFARRVVWESEFDDPNTPLPRSRMIGGQTEPEHGVPATVVSVKPFAAEIIGNDVAA